MTGDRTVAAVNKSLLGVIEERYKDFSKGQKLIADYITKHYDKAAFMTASKLGATAGVSESTVVRFATELGYDGYPQLQKALHEMVRSKLTSVQRIEVSGDRLDGSDIIGGVLNRDIELIRSTLEKTSREEFAQAAQAINRAHRIYILGVRSSAALASFMAFYFKFVFDSVVLVDTSSSSEIFEQMFRIGEDDVLIAISFPRYSKQTVDALRFASDRKATVIAITDSKTSPIAHLADRLLIAYSDMASFVDSLVAPLSLINALIVGSTMTRRAEVQGTFADLESIWDKYQVYENAEESFNDE